jgi:glucan phosphoethanolaminetransferase (alkaline phosphatase superfamily)
MKQSRNVIEDQTTFQCILLFRHYFVLLFFFPVSFCSSNVLALCEGNIEPKKIEVWWTLMYWTLLYCTVVCEVILRALLLEEKLVPYRQLKFYLKVIIALIHPNC